MEIFLVGEYKGFTYLAAQGHISHQSTSQSMHSTHAHRLPLGTSNNLDFGSYKLSLDFSLCFCMPPKRVDVINTIKT